MKKERTIGTEVARRRAAEEQLRESYAAVQRAHDDLKASQTTLIESEKMASLGLLSAGVAHEINNPVGYILSNISTLADYLPKIAETYNELKGIVEQIDETHPLYKAREAIEAKIVERDIDYLLDDTKDLVSETREGANRVLDIVRGLKNFAHADDNTLEYADINNCLESTLSLVKNELKYHCAIETKFGEVPYVNCSVSKLGQVFMNILVNASYAISGNGRIFITTNTEDNNVVIELEDNGSGMSEATLKQIFQPFYTTKPKGEGTGLGLAISYGIVEDHGGTIEATSTLGEGTKFSIRLPIDGPSRGSDDQLSTDN